MGNINRPKEGRFEELLVDSHVNQAVDRVMEALKNVHGTRQVPERSVILRDIANGISIFEANPDSDQKVVWGLILITRGPMDGWTIYVPAGDVYRIHLDTYFRDAEKERA